MSSSSDLKVKNGYMFFFDFDNTVSQVDVLDALIEKFSINDKWKIYEEAWKAGSIGSRECLELQIQSVRIKKKDLIEYLKTIELDPFFPQLIQMLRQKHIPHMIVSDSFSFIIKTILQHNHLSNIKIFANEIAFEGERLTPSFPFVSKKCARCAHCKRVHLMDYPDKIRVYVGDGLSDVCPALEADKVFAKDSLLLLLQQKNKSCTPFRDLGDLYSFVENLDDPLSSKRSRAYA